MAVSSRFLRIMPDQKKKAWETIISGLQHMNEFFYGRVPQTQGNRPVSAVLSIRLQDNWPLGMFTSRASFV